MTAEAVEAPNQDAVFRGAALVRQVVHAGPYPQRIKAAHELIELLKSTDYQQINRQLLYRDRFEPGDIKTWIKELQTYWLRAFRDKLAPHWRLVVTGADYRGNYFPVSRSLAALDEVRRLCLTEGRELGVEFNFAAEERIRSYFEGVIAQFGDVTPKELKALGGPVRDVEDHLRPKSYYRR